MSDEKYLQLVESEQQALAGYFEENQKQMLNALGPIQDLNIFVGSTNAGKSRLLRWIMNNKSFTLFNNKSGIDRLSIVRALCTKLADDIKHSKPHSVLVKYVNNQGWGLQYAYPKKYKKVKHWNIFQILNWYKELASPLIPSRGLRSLPDLVLPLALPLGGISACCRAVSGIHPCRFGNPLTAVVTAFKVHPPSRISRIAGSPQVRQRAMFR